MNSKAMLVRVLVVLGIVSLVFLAGCGGSTASTVGALDSVSGSQDNRRLSTREGGDVKVGIQAKTSISQQLRG